MFCELNNWYVKEQYNSFNKVYFYPIPPYMFSTVFMLNSLFKCKITFLLQQIHTIYKKNMLLNCH